MEHKINFSNILQGLKLIDDLDKLIHKNDLQFAEIDDDHYVITSGELEGKLKCSHLDITVDVTSWQGLKIYKMHVFEFYGDSDNRTKRFNIFKSKMYDSYNISRHTTGGIMYWQKINNEPMKNENQILRNFYDDTIEKLKRLTGDIAKKNPNKSMF